MYKDGPVKSKGTWQRIKSPEDFPITKTWCKKDKTTLNLLHKTMSYNRM